MTDPESRRPFAPPCRFAPLEILLDGLSFAEGPRWHDGRLWFSDFYRHEVVAVGLDGARERIVEVPHQPSGLGWLPNGDLLVVSMLDRKVLRFDGITLTEHADLAGLATGPCNDMVVDAEGRAYVGNFGFDRRQGEEARDAVLALVDTDGQVSVAAEGLSFPNGAVITPDGSTLIVGETLANRLTAFDRDPGTGRLSNRRVWADLSGEAMPAGPHYPDGICLDAAGAIWVTDPRGDAVLRVHEGGEVSDWIPTGDGRFSFAAMLGGEDGRTLFVLTNTGSGPDNATKSDGRIEITNVEIPGAGLP